MQRALWCVSIACLAFLVVGSRAVAQTKYPRDVIYGTITDSLTGAPLVGAKVRVRCATCAGRHETDSSGRYAVGRLPNGYWEIEYHCPSLTMLGRALPIRRASVGLKAAEVNVVVPPGACYEPPYFEQEGVFRGHWTRQFEGDAFSPCNADKKGGVMLPEMGGIHPWFARIWPTISRSSSAEAQVERWPWPTPKPLDDTYFVEWRGTLRGPGMYGHMGVSGFEMRVDTILSLRVAGRRDC